MKWRIRIVVVALALLVAGLGAAAGDGESDTDVEASIREAMAAYAEAAMASDAETFLGIHHDEAIKMPQDRQPYAIWDTADGLRSSFASRAQRGTLVMDIDVEEVTVSGEYAWAMGRYTKDFTSVEGVAAPHFEGKFLTIFKRSVDGEWLIYRDSYSSNTTPQ